MNVELIFQIAGVGIVVAVLNQLLIRSGREEQALLTTIAGLIVVFYVLTREIGNLFEAIKQIFNL
ncbi:MAG: stage III sporulation protein AC [Firmicutes bacterium]|nr:stage III sporulation protein AC [Bacillota bacterium]